MAKILIVEDDLELLSGLKDAMASQGYTVEVSTNGEDALDKLKAYKFDLIVLDWQLPGTSGVDVCAQFRGTGGLTPIIMLTGRSLIENKEEGLYAGADDYLTKPFEMRELLARVRACLRRPYTFTGDVLTVQDIAIEFDTRKVLKNGTSIDLLPMEYKLLEFLMRHRGQTFSASALLDRVWKSTSDVSEDAVRTCVKTLRRKIANSDGSSVLETVYGVGYKVS
ncbi:MAG: response regulator transcription factor [Candidatus Obscuribacterales bacterium]|nr:response regulator transcription factor [Candidatus Obscuribacterales bacterium]